jgi:F-type H+-transporting ATPase subunit delta
LNILEDVAIQFSVLYDFVNAIDKAVVTTAVPLTKELENTVLQKVKELTGKEASIENIVDEKILGGFILRIGDLRYDASISNQLESLRREFETDDYIAKI